MSWRTAKAAIDLLLKHSRETELPALGFYGGEPLLAWDRLKECLSYVETRGPLHLSLTTNGTLITEEIAATLNHHNVAVHVSLDGPEDIHNRFRRMRRGRHSAFAATLKGLSQLRRAYGDQARNKVYINAVAGPWTDYRELQEFFDGNPPKEIRGLAYRVSSASHPAMGDLLAFSASVETEKPTPSGCAERESRSADSQSVLLQAWLQALAKGEISTGQKGSMMRRMFETPMLRLHKRSTQFLADYLGPMGMCIPGVRKFYVDADGDILPCERVPEEFVLGNVRDGRIDPDKCEALLARIVETYGDRCAGCVFCRVCSGCLGSLTDSAGRISDSAFERRCVGQLRVCADSLLEYVGALERNPGCFDYMDALVIS